MKKISELTQEQNNVLHKGLGLLCILCLLGLAIFDIDRSTDAVSIMTAGNTSHLYATNPSLMPVGILWAIAGIFEFYLFLTLSHSKLIWGYRALVVCVIPSYIIYKVKLLGVELYSADIFAFVAIPICQLTLIVVGEIGVIKDKLLQGEEEEQCRLKN